MSSFVLWRGLWLCLGPFLNSTFIILGSTASSRINIYSSPSWDYFYNGNMQEIIPGVFLGPYSAAQLHCLTNLLERGIRYIICVRQETEAHFIRPQISDPSFTYLTLDIADHETENILRFFPKVNSFIDEALSKNCKVLVHGNNGNSRSATLVLAYIMEKFGLAVSEALCFVKTKRASVNPNEGFKAQLFEYEPIYKARQNVVNGGSSSSNRLRPKRRFEQLCETECRHKEIMKRYKYYLADRPDLHHGVLTATDTCDYDLIPPPPSPIPYDNNALCKNVGPTASEFSNNLYMLWMAKRLRDT